MAINQILLGSNNVVVVGVGGVVVVAAAAAAQDALDPQRVAAAWQLARLCGQAC